MKGVVRGSGIRLAETVGSPNKCLQFFFCSLPSFSKAIESLVIARIQPGRGEATPTALPHFEQTFRRQVVQVVGNLASIKFDLICERLCREGGSSSFRPNIS